MKSKNLVLLALLLCSSISFAQSRNAGILTTILKNYYKNEKTIVKGRNQLLFLYCDKANNNEELFETINQLGLSPAEAKALKKQVNEDKATQNWAGELDEMFAIGHETLKAKINACLSLEEYHAKQQKFNLNNQRMMIISKPVFWADGNTALVKVVFYRSIEHNSGSILLMKKKSDNQWEIKESLNPWAT